MAETSWPECAMISIHLVKNHLALAQERKITKHIAKPQAICFAILLVDLGVNQRKYYEVQMGTSQTTKPCCSKIVFPKKMNVLVASH